MADDKAKGKPKEKEVGGSGLFHKDHHKEVLYYLLPALLIIAAILERLFAWWDSLSFYSGSSFFERLLAWFSFWWPTWRVIAFILSILALAWAAYSFWRRRQIDRAEEKIFGREAANIFLSEPAKLENEQWQKVLAHAHSENPAEWRLAIIEADIMLDKAMRNRGYQGEGLAELLKAVDSSDMLTLDAAWEAHKVRNRIVHDGPSFELTDRETKRVITLFEAVFKEFGVI